VATRCAHRRHHPHEHLQRDLTANLDNIIKAELDMGRDLLLWLLGVPITVIILLHLFGVLHW
jgi:hypothetical protein